MAYCDFLGNELNIGDLVVHIEHGASRNYYTIRKVVGFTPHKVKVMQVTHQDDGSLTKGRTTHVIDRLLIKITQDVKTINKFYLHQIIGCLLK